MVDDQNSAEAVRIYSHLQQACTLLEQSHDHGIAAMVSHCMAMVHARYRVGDGHFDGLN